MSNTNLPLFHINAGPLDHGWNDRLKEELVALIDLVEKNVEKDNDWFDIQPIDESGIKWEGTCWFIYQHMKYEFKVQFEIPATYPATPIEIELPELDAKTEKMYRGGKICLDIHFAPLWRSMAPKYGIVHALCLALGPWLAAEIPYLVETGVVNK
jgi:ufm1-conjugating enzyme 1